MGQVRGPGGEAREEFSQAGVRPTEERPASVRPHLEPLRAPRAVPAERAGEGPEEEEKAGEESEQEGEEKARGKVRAAPEEPSEKEIEVH